jgi:hypothetical protein
MLQSNPDYMIDLANYEYSPQQNNTWDCGLFSFAVLLHLANKVPVSKDVFTQEHISKLRSALHKDFSNMGGSTSAGTTRSGRSLRFLTPQFLYSFFPKLPCYAPTRLYGAESCSSSARPHPPASEPQQAPTSNEEKEERPLLLVDEEGQLKAIVPVEEPAEAPIVHEMNDEEGDVLPPAEEQEQPAEATIVETRMMNEEEQEAALPLEEILQLEAILVEMNEEEMLPSPPPEEEEQQPEEEQPNHDVDDDDDHAQAPDHHFLRQFLPSTEEEDCSAGEDAKKKKPALYPDYEEIFTLIDEYESVSGFRLAIRRSTKDGGRTYCCASHEQCNFKAVFGRVRGSPHLISLKPDYSCFVHNGPPVAEVSRDGRSKKRRLSRKVGRAIKKVATVKALAVSPWDVVKSSVNTENMDITYMQGHFVLSKQKESAHAVSTEGYQKLVPYLKEFVRLNPGSAGITELDDDNHLDRVFVCPSIMQRSLMHVRPVMSLDAAHLKTTGGGGILYMASVKSACNHLYPVALAITSENENKDGWIWFLQNLQASLPVLEVPHPKEGVPYHLFTFISDRQKGLLEALKEVFPNNHSCYCAVHIARNVEAGYGGPKQSKYVLTLAKTFSLSEAQKLLAAMSASARAYVEAIQQPQWRSTAWLQDEALPPRYGIVTSNMSESLNSMFERARDVHWKASIHIMLSKMVERIAQLSEKYEHKTGVIDEVVGRLQYYWEHCAGLVVYSMKDEERSLYTVFSQSGGLVDEDVVGFNFNVATKSCDCGLWQEHGYPCIHAVAYYKKYLNYNLDQVTNEVDCKYTYDNESCLFEKNFLIVCDAKIEGDETVLTPIWKKKKKAGRTKKKRYRKRSVVFGGYSSSASAKGKCTGCGKPGHNVRTCLVRATLRERVDDEKDNERTSTAREPFEHMNESSLL